MHSFIPLGSLLVLVALAGCDIGTVTAVEPAGPAETSVTVQIRVAEPGLGQALGWADDAVPGAEVAVWPSSFPDDADISPLVTAPVVRVSADAAGVAMVGDQGTGEYRLRARRVLTAAELASLADTEWSDVVGVAGAVTVVVRNNGQVGVRNLGASSAVMDAPVEAVPMRQGGLVFDQWFMGNPRAFSGKYLGGRYLTIYNNGDTTAYLDGIIVASQGYWAWDSPLRTCAQSERYRHDEAGIWMRQAARFPGGGRDYPLLPGHGALLAVDAVDHRGQAQGQTFDLRGADFEFIGSSDVDNPAVPNMVSVARDPFSIDAGGFNASPQDLRVLWSPQSWSALPKEDDFFDSAPWTRLPAEGWLDAVSSRRVLDVTGGGGVFSWCDVQVARVFDREPVQLDFDEWRPTLAVYRRVALTLPDGRVVLQNTRTSAQDFFTAPPDPEAAPVRPAKR